MRTFNTLIAFMFLCHLGCAQIGLSLKGQVGHSILSGQTLIPTRGVLGLAAELHFGGERATVVFGAATHRIQTVSEYTKPFRFSHLSLGVNFTPKSLHSDWQFGAAILLAKSVLIPDQKKLPDNFAELSPTFWYQPGIGITVNYFRNKKIGFNSTLTHGFAKKYDSSNSLTYLTAGIVYRLVYQASDELKVDDK